MASSLSFPQLRLPVPLIFTLLLLILSPLALGHSHAHSHSHFPTTRRSSDRSPVPDIHAHSHARHALQACQSHGGGGRVVLPTNVRPVHYNLTLEPHFQLVDNTAGPSYNFDGRAVIDIDVVEETRTIVFNTKLLNMTEVALTQGSEVRHPNSSTTDTDNEQTTLLFTNAIPKGRWALQVRYTGLVNANGASGIYACPYEGPSGSVDVYFATQFEIADARRAFPSWDQPDIKANFSITLVTSANLTAVSSMPATHVDPLPGQRKAVHFATSPAMSTYLLAFSVGDLDYVETNDFRVPVRIYAPPSQDKAELQFAVETAARGLKYYEATLGVPFSLPKVDFLSISLKSVGGMENWGLITVGHDRLAVNNRTTAARKKQVAEVVLHELAHMWFGDLVTLEWWNDIWLNEGFANNLQAAAQSELFPDWEISQEFLWWQLIRALGIDEVLSTHPLRPTVTVAPETLGYFDGITYGKGASLLNMIRAWLGPDTFYAGLRTYLISHQYDNAETPDLWRSLGEVSGRDFVAIMDSWAEKPGFPVVAVVENTANGTITLRQNRYLRTETLQAADDQTVWTIPLLIRTADAVDSSAVMTQREQTFPLAAQDADSFLLNADHAGFWRVSYSTERMQKLATAISTGRLTQHDTIGLITDTCTLAPSGQQTASNCLEVASAAAHHSASGYYIWNQLIESLDSIHNGFQPDKNVTGQLRNFLHGVTATKAHELGWQISRDEGVVSEMFKAFMFYQAGKWGDQAAIQAARDMFWTLIRAGGGGPGNDSRPCKNDTIYAVHPALWETAFCLGVRYGGDSAYTALLSLIDHLTSNGTFTLLPYGTTLSSVNADFLDAAFSGQACTTSAANMVMTLNRAARLTPSQSSPLYPFFSALHESPTAVAATWDWMTRQGGWEKLTAGEEGPLMSPFALLQGTAPCLADANAAQMVREFFADKVGGDGDPFKGEVDLVVAGLEQRAAWVVRDGAGVREWFAVKGRVWSGRSTQG